MLVGLPSLAALCMIAVSPRMAGAGASPSVAALLGPLAAALFEEFGWRGTMLRDLLARATPIRAGGLVGVAWSAWHLPLFLIPGTQQSGWGNIAIEFAVFSTGTIALSTLFTVAYLRAGRRLFSVIAFHAAVNLAGLAAQQFAVVGLGGRVAESMVYVIAATVLARSHDRTATTAAGPPGRG